MTTKKTAAKKRKARTRSFPIPPADFDFASAEEAALREYGMDHISGLHSEIVEGFRKAMSTPTRFLKPRFRRVPRTKNGTLASAPPAGQASGNWSGALVEAPDGFKIQSIAGQWTIPNCAPSADGVTACSIWVGFDGNGLQDLLQAGIQCEFTRTTNGVQSQLYSWWEWLPNPLGIQKISVPVASIGHEVYCLITALSSTTGRIFLKNLTTNDATTFDVSAPDGGTLLGSSAEWIVEAPSVGGDPDTPLCNYGTAEFSSCVAGVSNGTSLSSSDGTSLYMQQDGQVVSTAAAANPGQLTCTYTGP
jgi:hypothetical protein